MFQFLNQSPKFLLSKARKTLNGYKSFCGRFYLFAALLEWKSPTIQNGIFYVENQIQPIFQVTNGCNGRKSPAAIPGNKTFAKMYEGLVIDVTMAHLIKNPFQLIIFLLHHNFRSITVVHLAQMHRRADIHFCSPCTGYLLAAELLALISQPLHDNIRFFYI